MLSPAIAEATHFADKPNIRKPSANMDYGLVGICGMWHHLVERQNFSFHFLLIVHRKIRDLQISCAMMGTGFMWDTLYKDGKETPGSLQVN